MNPNHNSSELFLQTACDIGAQLANDAIWHQNQCNWLGSATTGRVPVYKTQNASLYDGTIGIAYFLTGLYAINPTKVFRNTIDGAVNQALNYQDKCDSLEKNGFYNSAIGLAYGLWEVSQVLQKDDWVKTAQTMLKQLQLDENDLDLFSLLKVLTPLVKLSQQVDFEFLKESLQGYITKANELCEQFQWDSTSEVKQNNLDELSTLVMGLLTLHEYTQQPNYLELARKGLSFIELQWKNRKFDGTFPSRATETRAYLKMYAITKQESDLNQLNAIGNYLIQSMGFSFQNPGHPQVNFSLQNGIASKIDSLLDIAQFLRNQYFQNMAQHYGMLGVQQLAIPGLLWPSNRLDKQPCPGLMVGLSGIGYVYLRLFAPEKYQSVWNLSIWQFSGALFI